MPLSTVHQQSHVTGLDRYPALYAGVRSVAAALFAAAPLRLLVVGCSTGQEPLTLAQHYFTSASHRIHAADLASDVLELAETHHAHPRIRYFNIACIPADCRTFYQIVFANSVFCRWPDSRGVDSIAEIYPFAAFEAALVEIDQSLVAGGLLALYNANYRFTDALLAERYVSMLLPGMVESGFVTKFDPDGMRSVDQSYPYALFLKVADS